MGAFKALVGCVLLATSASSAFAMEDGEMWQIGRFWNGPKRPLIEMWFGNMQVKQKLFTGDLAGANSGGLRLGYYKAEPSVANLAEVTDKYLFFSYGKSELFGRAIPAGNTASTITRFGFGDRSGFAYDFGSTYLYPYSQNEFVWTQFNSHRPPGVHAGEADILDRYEGAIRFGAMMEGGLAFGLAETGHISVGYQAGAIYPRHVFWPWIGSYVVATLGVGAISRFAEEINEFSPTLGPVLYALLRSGLAYGYYLAVRDNQYWPFKSEAPLTTEGLTLGITLTF
jgi:hypothetical protein